MLESLLALTPIGLVLLPVYVWRSTRDARSQHAVALTGVTFGLIAAPFSSALYGLFFLSCFTAPIGLIGLVLSQIHGVPGYELAALLGWHDRHTVIRGQLGIALTVLNGIVWASVYGGIGAIADQLCRLRRRRHTAEPDAG